jgi:hypothetical protein
VSALRAAVTTYPGAPLTELRQRWPQAGPLLKHHAQIDLIDAHRDDLLRDRDRVPLRVEGLLDETGERALVVDH